MLSAVTALAVPPYSFGANRRTQAHYISARAAPSDLHNFYIGVRSTGGLQTHYISARAAPSGLQSGGHGYQQGDLIGRLYVERLGRVVSVFEGETMRNMDFGAGRFSFSGLNFGNTALIGHNRGSNGFFSFVRLLENGDILRLETGSVTREYVVVGTRIVGETDFSWAADFGDTRLTLVTCVEYRRAYRRILYAIAR